MNYFIPSQKKKPLEHFRDHEHNVVFHIVSQNFLSQAHKRQTSSKRPDLLVYQFINGLSLLELLRATKQFMKILSGQGPNVVVTAEICFYPNKQD